MFILRKCRFNFILYDNKFIGETRFWHSFSNEHKNKIINVLQTMNHKPYSKMATILILFIFKYLISKGLVIHRQVKINDKKEQRFGVVMTPLSSSK